MKNARLFSLTLLIFGSAVACGGRVVGDDLFRDPDGATDGATETGLVDGDPGFDGDPGDGSFTDGDPGDGSFVDVDPFETGVVDGSVPDTDPTFDSAAFDTGPGFKDTSVSDTAVKDTAVSDTAIKDTSVVDTGSDGGADTATDTPPDAPITTVCDKITAATCTTAFKSCCTSKGYAWDQLGCEDVANNWCDDARDGVSGGKTTYNPSFADACVNAWKSATTACSLHILDYIANQVPCSQLFNGKTLPGFACTRSSECYAGPGQLAWCDESSKRCRAYQIVGKGQSCNYFGTTIRYCQKGLYCNYASTPVCDTATPIGGSCFGIDDTSCGIGNTCKAGKCAPGAPPGTSCTRDLECASWSCDFGKCTDPNITIASKALCSGI